MKVIMEKWIGALMEKKGHMEIGLGNTPNTFKGMAGGVNSFTRTECGDLYDGE